MRSDRYKHDLKSRMIVILQVINKSKRETMTASYFLTFLLSHFLTFLLAYFLTCLLSYFEISYLYTDFEGTVSISVTVEIARLILNVEVI